jgi:hypothetical protein
MGKGRGSSGGVDERPVFALIGLLESTESVL